VGPGFFSLPLDEGARAMSDLVCLQEFSSRMEAAMACEILEASAVSATVFADDGGGAFQGVLFSRGVARLMVLPEDLERARQILEQLQEPPGQEDGIQQS